MGVKNLWQVLDEAGLLVDWTGDASSARLLSCDLNAKVIAIDLSMWIMQASEQEALLPHFSQDAAHAKVAFERAIQHVRFGVTPVFVVEGKPPEEKADTQRRRMFEKKRFAGRASSGPGRSFTAMCSRTGKVLEAMGLPVVYAPGEAEATCAALCHAGVVDAASTFDSDCLVYGAEVVYKELRLSATSPKACKASKFSMTAARSYLGLTQGGDQAMLLVATLAGCDYEGAGAEGVGSIGGLALVRQLLQDHCHDRDLLDLFEQRLRAPPNEELLAIRHCTGCSRCGHEGSHKGKIKSHTKANPCEACFTAGMPQPAEAVKKSSSFCVEKKASRPCQCAFHARSEERMVERLLQRIRQDYQGFMERMRNAVRVFDSQGREAKEYVEKELQSRQMQPGQKFAWVRRPSALSVYNALQALPRNQGLPWDVSVVRGKLLPALLEWDMRAGPAGQTPLVEFRPVGIKKVHGNGREGEAWRYLVEWERLPGRNTDGAGSIFRASKADSKRAPSSGGGDLQSQRSAGQEERIGEERKRGDGLTSTQTREADEEALENMSVQEFDEMWLRQQSSSVHKAVRQVAIRMLWPGVEAAWVAQLAALTTPRSASTGRRNGAAVRPTSSTPAGHGTAGHGTITGRQQRRGGGTAGGIVVGPMDAFLVKSARTAHSVADLNNTNITSTTDNDDKSHKNNKSNTAGGVRRGAYGILGGRVTESPEERPSLCVSSVTLPHSSSSSSGTTRTQIETSPTKRQRTPPTSPGSKTPRPQSASTRTNPTPPQVSDNPYSEKMACMHTLPAKHLASRAARTAPRTGTSLRQEDAKAMAQLQRRGSQVGTLLAREGEGLGFSETVVDLVTPPEGQRPPALGVEDVIDLT